MGLPYFIMFPILHASKVYVANIYLYRLLIVYYFEFLVLVIGYLTPQVENVNVSFNINFFKEPKKAQGCAKHV